MSMGMLFMVAAFTVAGIVQVYLWRLIGMDFMVVRTEYMSFWMFWVFFFGLTLFTPGVLIYVWDFFTLGAKSKVAFKPARAGATE
jgi:nitric oxide reductase subunit B